MLRRFLAAAVCSLLVLGFGAAVLTLLPGKDVRAGVSGVSIEDVLEVPIAGNAGNETLVMVNALERKLLVYRLDQGTMGQLMLNANRDYLYDLAFDEWPISKVRAATSLDMRKLIEESDDYKKDKEAKKVKDVEEFIKGNQQTKGLGIKESDGKTLLVTVTPVGGGQQSSLLYLTDKANKKILIYEIANDKVVFLASRRYEYDEKLPFSGNYSKFESYEEVKKKWLAFQKQQQNANK